MTDRTLVCCDCGREFVFTAAEQEFFRERELTHDPKRCLECRKERRRKHRGPPGGPQRGDGERPARPAGPGEGPRRPRPPSRPPSRAPARPPTKRPVAEEERVAETPHHPAAPDRPVFEATCATCGEVTRVPFEPDGVRPVFCLPCLKKRTRG